MNQEKFGEFIKEIRKKHNLTQKELADKYNVTYQAVSKWETGKNMPDSYLIKKISEDFKVSLEELYDGEFKTKKRNRKIKYIMVLIVLLIILGVILFINYYKEHDDFKFRVISSSCDNFSISGNIAYNKHKSAIYITNIKYCGEYEENKYKHIECILYESNNNIERKISSYKYEEDIMITLEEFLKKVTFNISNYDKVCQEYNNNTFYLTINAYDNEKITSYKIPLSMNDDCIK